MALQFLPMLLLGVPGGVLADKFDNRRLLIATSTMSGLIAVMSGGVIVSGHVTGWWIYVLTLTLGLVRRRETPSTSGPRSRSGGVRGGVPSPIGALLTGWVIQHSSPRAPFATYG